MEVAAVAARGRAAPAHLAPFLSIREHAASSGPDLAAAAWPRARPAWRGGVASSCAHAASSSAGPRATATSSRRWRTGLGVWPPFLSLLSLSLYLSLLRRSDPAPGSRDQAAGPQAGYGRARRPAGREEPRACAARSRRGVASPSGGEERAAGRMGSASRRPLVAGWTGTIFFDDVATLSLLLLVRKSYCKIR